MAENLELQNEARRTLFLEYVHAGLILFGRFQAENGDYWPLSFHLTLLPSFPKMMKMTADLLVPFCPPMSERDRLLTTRNTTALGGVLATLTDIPMLYPYGEIKSYTAAFTIEGAADVGHPTTLLTDILLDGVVELQVAERAAQVGIPVKRIVALIDARRHENSLFQRQGITEIQALFPLQESIQWVAEAGFITQHLAQRIFDWQATLP